MTRHISKKIFIVAGEHSGDLLGGKLISALKSQLQNAVEFSGVGGDHMIEQGFKTIFPMSDVVVMGPVDIAKVLPKLIHRVYQTVDAAIAFKPDLLVIIDSPEFTHPIAKRIRKRLPNIPIIDYVSPSVWAWRSGRARKMRTYVDHVLALLPFEPEAHERLGGPKCTYVGHPMIEKLDFMKGQDGAALRQKLQLKDDGPVLVVLPGSRSNEIKRLMEPFGQTLERLLKTMGPLEVILPVVPSVRNLIEQGLLNWPIKPHLVEGESDKFAAFSLATAALAASGTVTLELALCRVPMVVAYKGDLLVSLIKRFMLKTHSVVLANLVLGENVFPELLQEDCTEEKLFAALLPLLNDTKERQNQLAGLEKISHKMTLDNSTPSQAAARVILNYLQ